MAKLTQIGVLLIIMLGVLGGCDEDDMVLDRPVQIGTNMIAVKNDTPYLASCLLALNGGYKIWNARIGPGITTYPLTSFLDSDGKRFNPFMYAVTYTYAACHKVPTDTDEGPRLTKSGERLLGR